MDKQQLIELIEHTLQHINLYSVSATNLLLGTCAVESRMGTYVKQVAGPACGIMQMEPATEKDIWDNFLEYRASLSGDIFNLTGVNTYKPVALWGNLHYQIAMARVHYLRVPEKLPEYDDIDGLATYWKLHYNTSLGKGTITKFKKCYLNYVIR
ncbi:MAG: hypothetical protein DRJ03_07475 [Chloroflexi bacterium]|nr:MAG: hypothetical protein DRJ03_07475 [Chloroflexota bacterium]